MPGRGVFSKLLFLPSVAVLAVAFSTPALCLAASPGESCCQCPLPSCGPPLRGTCDPGCVRVPEARCDGATGRCVATAVPGATSNFHAAQMNAGGPSAKPDRQANAPPPH